jgi:hypothetical protein
MQLPDFNERGDLPDGVYLTRLDELIKRFGATPRRAMLSRRLRRIFDLAQSTARVKRFIVFGSFVTAKPEPNDVDIFLLMEDSFDVREVLGESSLVFDHHAAQNVLGASIFWVRQSAALGGEQGMIEFWQTKRDGTKRGIVEMVQ